MTLHVFDFINCEVLVCECVHVCLLYYDYFPKKSKVKAAFYCVFTMMLASVVVNTETACALLLPTENSSSTDGTWYMVM